MPLVKRHAPEAKEKRKSDSERERPQEDVQAERAIPKEQIRPDSKGRSHSGDADGKPCPAAHWQKMLPAAGSARRVGVDPVNPSALMLDPDVTAVLLTVGLAGALGLPGLVATVRRRRALARFCDLCGRLLVLGERTCDCLSEALRGDEKDAAEV